MPNNDDLDTDQSIDLFIKCTYDLNGTANDTEWVEDFEEKY